MLSSQGVYNVSFNIIRYLLILYKIDFDLVYVIYVYIETTFDMCMYEFSVLKILPYTVIQVN